MDITQIIREVQKELKKTDPTIDVDGRDGPQTWTAIQKIVKEYVSTLFPEEEKPKVDEVQTSPILEYKVDDRSEKAIATLHEKVKPYARALVYKAKAEGITIIVTSAYRTYAEQNALYAKGNVTKAKGGYSSHNFATAFDITIFNGKTPVWESPNYQAIGAWGTDLGLSWGGKWSGMVDEPHFYLKPEWAKNMKESEMMAGLRKRVAAKKDVFEA